MYTDKIANLQITHATDSARVQAIIEAIESGVVMPPVLVVEATNEGAYVLDGNHRAAAARELGIAIDALVVPLDEFEAIIAEHFDGSIPDRMSDLDGYLGYTGRDCTHG